MQNEDIVTTEQLDKDVDEIIQKVNKKKSKSKSLFWFVFEMVIWCTVIIAGIKIFFCFYKLPEVQGSSMEPTYYNGDVLLARVTKNVSHNDIVVVWSDNFDEYLIKRVIGVAGDHIEINNGVLKRNGEIIVEEYLNEKSWGADTNLDVIVPEKTIFIMGDNRNHSADSRTIGCVSIDNIYGRVVKKVNWLKKWMH